MKRAYYTKKNWVIIGLLLPPVILLVNYCIFGKSYFSGSAVFWWSSLLTAGFGMISWYLQLLISLLMNARYPGNNQTLRRVVTSMVLHVLVTIITVALVFVLYDRLNFFHYQLDPWRMLMACIISAGFAILAASFHEAVAFYEKWKKVTDEAEHLKKVNLQTQLESLKAQVNPHFLFNSLNSLSSLISEDPTKAEKFLDEMCKVYRYLLRNNEDDLAPLWVEMQFINSYYHLLKTRYGDSLFLEMNIADELVWYRIPSLTLQMLVENAVKHNMMLKDRPLQIVITTVAGPRLIVSNNLQRKKRISSNKVGLNNIVNKYKLLKQDDIIVQEDEKTFAVVVPLIKVEEEATV
ncbi:sensor histidine kinase [Paraflavitalea pollutisoli]|uniref:sensor histidine kinase n=1 Tax=Paraflavitalea pollutisoli TaxID=3034143 RepID=UPI0023ED3672|nr:histidine kinase [Paraflavitalea sp. H1-2-19X]